MAILPPEAKQCFSCVWVRTRVGIRVRAWVGLGLGLFNFGTCSKIADRTILPPNGKIPWGCFASRGKIASAKN